MKSAGISSTTVISYWSGVLPEISRLHFLSFRANEPHLPYILYLESDTGFEGSIPDSLANLLLELRIEIRSIGLTGLMASNQIPKFSHWKDNRIFKLGKYVIYKISPLFEHLPSQPNIFNKSPKKGITFSHHVPFTGFVNDLAYRADIFRALAISIFNQTDFLYLDLDICLVRPLTLTKWKSGAIAQWGTDNFANSAFLFVPQMATNARSKIIGNLQYGISALPWVLYSRDRVDSYEFEMIPNHLLDPAWDPNSVISGQSELFFRSGSHVKQFMRETKDIIAIHWHNQWAQIPEKNSPYDILMEHFKDELDIF